MIYIITICNIAISNKSSQKVQTGVELLSFDDHKSGKSIFDIYSSIS